MLSYKCFVFNYWVQFTYYLTEINHVERNINNILKQVMLININILNVLKQVMMININILDVIKEVMLISNIIAFKQLDDVNDYFNHITICNVYQYLYCARKRDLN